MVFPPSEATFRAVGQAVYAAQLFETALVPIAELHRLHVEPGRAEKTGGYLPAGAYRLATSRLVKDLSTLGTVDPGLQERITAYLDERHTLIHRWIVENGLPTTAEDDAKLRGLAERVEREAKDLARYFINYVVQYAEPDWAAANPEEYASRMRALFKGASLGEGHGRTADPDEANHLADRTEGG